MPEQLKSDIADLLTETRELKEICKTLLSRMRRNEALLIVCVTALMLGAVSVVRTQQLMTDRENERNAQLYGSCVQFNTQRAELRQVFKTNILALAPDPNHLTPEQEELLARYATATDGGLQYRDCSQDGIHEYLLHPPVDPATIVTTTTR